MSASLSATASYHRSKARTHPHLPAAGLGGPRDWEASDSLSNQEIEESAAQCVRPDIDPRNQRPPTPERMKRYRKSYQRQPGRHFITPGLVDQQIPANHFRYGVRLNKGDKVQETLEQLPMTELQNFANDEAESMYHSHIREPLGKSYNRGHILPDATKQPDFRFGQAGSSSETSKALIYFDEKLMDQRVSQQYPSKDPQWHREREITRQVDRNYDWTSAHIDPMTQRFGKTEVAEKNGVASALKHDPLETQIGSKRVHEIRNYSHDRLGQAREVRGTLRQLGSDFVYGRASTPDEWGARKCIGGGYGLDEQLPDKDLGVSTRQLDPYTSVPFEKGTHTYGTPSIRADITAPRLRSVADPQNYGDEHNAKGLLYPSKFAHDGVEESDFLRGREPLEIRQLFLKMGTAFSDAHFDRICETAKADFQVLSCDSFRHAYNKMKLEGQ